MARRVNKQLIVSLTIGAMVVTAGAAVVLVNQLPETDPELIAERARRLIAQGEVLKGAAQLRRASTQSKDPKYLVEAGQALLDDGNVPDARALWSLALVLDTGYEPAHDALIKQALETGRRSGRNIEVWQYILSRAEALLEVHGDSALGLNARGLARLQLANEDPSSQKLGEADLVAAVADDPGNAEYTQDLAKHYQDTKRGDQARAAFEALLEASPDDPDALRFYAQFLLQQQEPEASLAQLVKAQELAPQNVDVQLAVGKYWQYLQDTDKSEQAFRKAVEIDPDGYNAYLELGLLFITSERPTEALALYETRLDRGPAEGGGITPAENRFYHATLLEHAINALISHVIQRSAKPDDEAIAPLLAKADAYLKERVAERGESNATHAYRGTLAMLRGDDVAAVKAYEEAMRPGMVPHPLTARNLPTLYLKQNQPGKAERTLTEVLTLFPLHADAPASTLDMWTKLAYVQNQLQRPAEAIRTLDRVLEYAPDHRPALVEKSRALRLQIQAATDDVDKELLTAELVSLLRRTGMTADDGSGTDVTTLILEGKLDEAEATLVKLREARPDDENLVQKLVAVYLRTERQAEAVTLVDEVAARNPDNLTFKRWQIILAPTGNAADRDRKILETLSGITEPLARAVSLADHAAQRGDLAEARKQLDLAEKADPDSQIVLQRQFMLAMQDKAWERAETYVTRLGDANVDGAGGRMYRGQLFLARADVANEAKDQAQATRRLEQAVDELSQALDEFPSNSMAQTFLGIAYRGLGRYDAARVEFEEAVRLNPINGEAQKHLAQLAYLSGDTELGDEHLAVAARNLPRDPWVQARLRELAERMDPAAGIQRREALRAEKPDDVGNLIGLARLYVLRKQNEQALAVMHEAHKQQPDNRQVVLATANLLGESGQLDQGERVITDWIASRPDDRAKASGYLALASYFRRTQHAYPLDVKQERAGKAYDEAVRLAGDDANVSLAMARWQRVLRAFDEAATWYDKAVTMSDSASTRARIRLEAAEMFRVGGQPDVAMERIEAIQRDFPDDLRGDLIAGMIELDRARSAAALSRFNKVIENDADNVQAYYQRALLHFRQSRWPECLSDLNRTKLLAPDGFDYQHRIQLARALELSGRRDEAVSELDEIRSTAPQASRVAAALIDMYQRQERWSEAEGLLVEYTSRFPEEPDWAYRRGAFALRRNNLGEAVLWLRKATELSAYSPVVTDAYLGAVLTTGNWDEVIRFATTVLPEDRRATAAVRRSLAMAYARKGEQEKAWSAIESILAERITMTEMQRIVSDLSQVHGRTPAIELVKARHQTKPDHRGLAVLNAVMVGAVAKDAAAGLARVASLLTDAREDYEKLLLYQVAGVLHYGESQYEQARTAYEAALKIDPDDLLSLNNLAYLLASDLGEPAAALPYAEQAVMVQSQDAGALDTLGWVHYQLGNLDSAVAKLLQATQVDTNNIDGYYHLGLAYQKRGNRPDAIRSWQTAVRLSGDGGKTGSAAQARQALEELGVSLDPS